MLAPIKGLAHETGHISTIRSLACETGHVSTSTGKYFGIFFPVNKLHPLRPVTALLFDSRIIHDMRSFNESQLRGDYRSKM